MSTSNDATDALDRRRIAENGASAWQHPESPTSPAVAGRVARVSRASRANASPMSVGTLRSCTSSKITRSDARQLRIVLQPPGQHTFGDDLDPRVAADPPLVSRLDSRRARRPRFRAGSPFVGQRRESPAAAARASRCDRRATAVRSTTAVRRSSCRRPAGDEQRRCRACSSAPPSSRQHVDDGKVASRGRQRHGSAECWCAVERPRVAGHRDGRADPRRRRGDLLGDRHATARRPNPRRRLATCRRGG